MARYKKQRTESNKTSEDITTPGPATLDQLVVEGARRLVVDALLQEITDYLGRVPYERHSHGGQTHYRNGYGKERTLTAGSGSFQLRVPRSREPFGSEIVRHYQRYSNQIGT